MKVSLEKTYPNIARWVDEHEGWIEIGYDGFPLKIFSPKKFLMGSLDVDSPLNSFVRALDCGGMLWEGKDSYDSLDEAMQEKERRA